MRDSAGGTIYRHDPELRARLQAFSPDEPGAVFPFSARLARENGWSRARALRVVEEYRRFLYLAMTAGHPVTPSVDVDQAWHLHLTCTRSYWEELCGRVLGRPLHHDPTRGGRAEGEKFVDWYARTLASYRAAFGQAPPADVWPAPGARFAPAARIRQVSDATHWVIRKPRLRPLGRVVAGAGALLSVLGLAACAADPSLVALLIVGFPILVVGLIIGAEVSTDDKKRRQPDGGTDAALHAGGGGNCDSPAGGDCGDGGGGDGGGGCGGGCGGCGG